MSAHLSIRKPSPDAIHAFLRSQSTLNFSYPSVGATATTPPPGYAIDRARIKLGQGQQTFEAAKSALETWTHFRLGWVEATPLEPSIQVGNVVAVAAKAAGVWWLNACRIVYLVHEEAPIIKSGFAYGTLPAHAETGEERFLIEWDPRSNAVHYDILAFSKPHGPLSHLGYPWVRHLQKRFRDDSASAMLRAVTR